MDEVRIERLFEEYDKDCLFVIIRDWPISEEYKGRPDLVASLENLVIKSYFNYSACCGSDKPPSSGKQREIAVFT